MVIVGFIAAVVAAGSAEESVFGVTAEVADAADAVVAGVRVLSADGLLGG